ncbi:hypothetical protein SNEBB_006867 [Seison nebaliae]|nr:hypothetical protein SNEBB_006867 [Seison nebaliae]
MIIQIPLRTLKIIIPIVGSAALIGVATVFFNRKKYQDNDQFLEAFDTDLDSNKLDCSKTLMEKGVNYLQMAMDCWVEALVMIEEKLDLDNEDDSVDGEKKIPLPDANLASMTHRLQYLLEKTKTLSNDCEIELEKNSKALQYIQEYLEKNRKSQARRTEIRERIKQLTTIKDDLSIKPVVPLGPATHQEKDMNKLIMEMKPKKSRSMASRGPLSFKSRSSYSVAGSHFSDVIPDDIRDDDSFYSTTCEFNLDVDQVNQNIQIDNSKSNDRAFYEEGMKEVLLGQVHVRKKQRWKLLKCESEIDYNVKLYCIRNAFELLFDMNIDLKKTIEERSRRLLVYVMKQARGNAESFINKFTEIIEYTNRHSNLPIITEELSSRNVMEICFFDIVFDFVLLDAFEDLSSPPSSLETVMNNNWLGESFKRNTIFTIVWSALKTKRCRLRYSESFMSHFYDVSEHISPALAWGFLGNDKKLKDKCNLFRDEIMRLLCRIFNAEETSYTDVESLSESISTHLNNSFDYIEENFEL